MDKSINGLMDKKRAAMPIFYAEAVYKQLGMLRMLQLSNWRIMGPYARPDTGYLDIRAGYPAGFITYIFQFILFLLDT